ncbi:MAG: type II secretion system protein [Candidatus Paceibacterota bacterium]|jgi:prepilin-type N-terminal cleavage/methylation domain-containing protein
MNWNLELGTWKFRASGGFSLVEILVSLAIFSVVMVTAAGALLTTIDANHKAQAVQLAVNNLSFALESMSRPIREGNSYPADGVSSSFTFKKNDSSEVSYYLDNGRIMRKEGGNLAQAITSLGVTVTKLAFYVSGSSDPKKQPLVTIVIQGTAGETAKIQTTFNLQTTLSQRIPR